MQRGRRKANLLHPSLLVGGGGVGFGLPDAGGGLHAFDVHPLAAAQAGRVESEIANAGQTACVARGREFVDRLRIVQRPERSSRATQRRRRTQRLNCSGSPSHFCPGTPPLTRDMSGLLYTAATFQETSPETQAGGCHAADGRAAGSRHQCSPRHTTHPVHASRRGRQAGRRQVSRAAWTGNPRQCQTHATKLNNGRRSSQSPGFGVSAVVCATHAHTP